jgi:hypothetical protein
LSHNVPIVTQHAPGSPERRKQGVDVVVEKLFVALLSLNAVVANSPVGRRSHDRLRDPLGQSRKRSRGVARKQTRRTLAAERIGDRIECRSVCCKKGLMHPPKLGPEKRSRPEFP